MRLLRPLAVCTGYIILLVVPVQCAVFRDSSAQKQPRASRLRTSTTTTTESEPFEEPVTSSVFEELHPTEEQASSTSAEPETTPLSNPLPLTVDPAEPSPDFVSIEEQKEEIPKRKSWVQRVAYVVKSPRVAARSGARAVVDEGASSDTQDDFENLSWVSQVITKSMWKYTPRSESNSACTHQGELYRRHFSNLTQWAVKMFDSADIAPNGVLETDHLNSGHFDECLTIDVKSLDLKGQYCLVKAEYSPHKELSPEFWAPDKETNYNQPDPMKTVWLDAKPHTDPARKNRSEFEFAVCLPKSCSARDLQVSLQETVNRVAAAHKLNFKLTVRPQDCAIKDPEIRDPLGFTLTVLIGLSAGGLVFIGTFLDILVFQKNKSKSLLRTCLKPFSVARNLERLQKPSEDAEFTPVNFFKLVILVQIINGHRIMFTFGNRIYNPSWIERLARHPLSAYVNGASSVIVDFFFVIGGFLAYLFIYRTLLQKKRVNLVMVFFYRWLRIVPLYALVIAFYTFVMPSLGEGPVWNRFVERDVAYCRKNWWLNLLFINNYVHSDQLCMIHSWYLSVDMQLFILTSFIAVFIFHHQKAAKLVLGTVVTLSIVLPAMNLYFGKFHAVTFAFQQFLQNINADPNFYDMYIRTHTRAIPYILGLTSAHIYLKLKDKKFKFTKRQLWMCVGLCFVFGNASVFYSALLYLPGWPYNIVEHMIYNPLHRILFAFIPCFILIAQGTTGFGIVSRFMSSPFFGVMGRLTYCGYLIHPIVQLTMIYSNRTAFSLAPLRIAWASCGDTLATFILALALNLLFESPIDRLQKKIFQSFIREYKEPRTQLEPQTEEAEMSDKPEVTETEHC
nr:PREDICTED: nose resistant to fluoxetine protein 6-like [Bemisia tabaci]